MAGGLSKLIRCFTVLASLFAFVPANAQTTSTYTYDALGRLTSAVDSNGAQSTYGYDPAGNRTQLSRTAVTAPPTVGGVSLTTAYNTPGTATLTPSGNWTSLAIATPPSHGTASISGTTLHYTPTTGYSGGDTMTYTATGPGGTSAPGTVSITVGSGPPNVGNVTLTTAYNTPGTTTLTPSGNWTSLAIATQPTHGTASISGTTLHYTPTTGYHGSDSLTYTATGPGGTSAPGTVAITVTAPAAPTVGNTSLTTAYNTPGTATLLPSGTYTSLAIATQPAHGAASISGTTLTYTPTSGYYGSDSLAYTATGPGGTSAPGTVSVTVNKPAAPTVGNVTLTTSYNTAGSATLTPSGVYTSLAVATAPAHGTASISGTTLTYTPTSGYSGSDSLTYTATGPGGTSSPGTVSITVGPGLSVAVSSVSWKWMQTNNGPITETPANISCTPSGGTAPYTYNWVKTSGDSSTVATAGTTYITAWTRGTTPANSIPYYSDWVCQVTDHTGAVASSATILVNFLHSNGQ